MIEGENRKAAFGKAELKQEIAMLLFQQQKLSLLQASQLAGMPRIGFEALLISRNIPPYSYEIEDYELDL
ncbi:UPF0175 family protein [Oscillatoria sp. HE19RPO]|uniref:UPF0175 family protein n=1 Tax=Oscillatoria sp. HE19RPO TaxID=2954806 RepID=UPI0020C4592A|nr:UPF0175 family protein [Oscillatoria sp. HE19RPO]